MLQPGAFSTPRCRDPSTMHPHHPDNQAYWYPPGHGDVLRSLISESLVDKLIARGVEWIFISSGDNLGAVVDPRIVGYLATLKGVDFVSGTNSQDDP